MYNIYKQLFIIVYYYSAFSLLSHSFVFFACFWFYFTAIQITNYSATASEWDLLKAFETDIATQNIQLQGLEYIAGYVAHKFRLKYKNLGTPTKMLPVRDNWISCISRGNCMHPSTEFMKVAEVMNTEFEIFHGSSLSMEDKIFDKLTSIVSSKTKFIFPVEVIACLVRTRTYIRLRNINFKIKMDNTSRKKNKKTKKMCNLISSF